MLIARGAEPTSNQQITGICVYLQIVIPVIHNKEKCILLRLSETSQMFFFLSPGDPDLQRLDMTFNFFLLFFNFNMRLQVLLSNV